MIDNRGPNVVETIIFVILGLWLIQPLPFF